MMGTRARRWMMMLALGAMAGFSSQAVAGDLYSKEAHKPATAPLPKPADVRTLAVYPEKLALKGGDDARQLIVSATLADGRIQDLTGAVQYDVADQAILRVSSSGQVVPLANGNSSIVARFGDFTLTIPVQIQAVGQNLPINFANQIVPIFTKLGCNGGGCHGKASGQNGFKLSLLGFEPELDFTALVEEARGRRLLLAAPDSSLLLLKATGTVAHGGGKRLDKDSDEYKMIRRWIAAGVPYGQPDDPVVTHISVYPEHRVLTRENRQQIAAYAHYSDGTIEDITRRAQYETNDQEIAVVDGTGLVQTLGLSGEAAIMARYQGQVAVFRATVPLGGKTPSYQFEPITVVDRYTAKKWQQLGIVPSGVCPDNEFIRRVYLDVAGTLPTPDQVRAFLANNDPKKRDRLIDKLLDSPEYAYYFANRWADILRVKRGNQAARAYGTFAFHDWIRVAMANDKPYDEFARAILGAVGDETKYPPTVWYKDMQSADQIVDNLSQVFLGVRINCAQCHHHPYEKWSQDDYWDLAAFFGRLGRKTVQQPGQTAQKQQQQQVLFVKATGSVTNKRTGKAAIMKPLDGKEVPADAEEDPRQALADWMADAKNPFFARAVVNRYWAHFFGRGIVDPLDDMRVTNPPSNSELLDALAQDFVAHHFSLKHLVATICKSRTYQLSAEPNEYNKHDKQNYSRYYPKRMSAEVLYDAVAQVTGSAPSFAGLPQDTYAPRRAIMLPDESFQSYFLDVFGRPQRLSACECERVSEANLAQVLHMLNSDEIQRELSQSTGRAAQLAKDPRPDNAKIDELFLWVYGRPPTADQMRLALDHLAAHAKDKQAAYENILWALINTKEFIFNR